MRSQFEIDAAHGESMQEMIGLIEQGMNALEISEEMGLGVTPHMVRQRSYKLGLTITPVRRKLAERTTEFRSKPCKCHTVCMDHRFRADLVCDCGKEWEEQQKRPTRCDNTNVVHADLGSCRKGHKMTEANTYRAPKDGRLRCVSCRNRWADARQAAIVAKREGTG